MADIFEQIQPNWNNRLRWFIAASLLLHLILIFLFGSATNFRFLDMVPEIEAKDKNDDIVFEIVESPDKSNTDKLTDETRFASDKSMTAKNPERTENISDLPFNPGQTEFAEIPTNLLNSSKEMTQKAETEPSDSKETESKARSELELEEFALDPTKRRSFSRDLLVGKKPASQPQASRPSFENKKFSVEDMGGFAFNTYNWNFAPYMLYLKKHIQAHVFPPPAFSKMGIIEGRSVVRFLINKDGSLRDIQILDTEGHKSLLETSTNAVNSSSPFRPLPSSFPEDYLEVTGTFLYTVYKDTRNRDLIRQLIRN